MKLKSIEWEEAEVYEGISLEDMITKATNEESPIDTAAATTYTERKDGVLPEFDIRTDRWEIAQDAMDHTHRSIIARRQENLPDKDANIVNKVESHATEN